MSEDAAAHTGRIAPPLQIQQSDPFAAPPVKRLASTPGQLEIWVAERVDASASCAFNESFSVLLTGSIDEAALIRALQTLPDLHEALRGHLSANSEQFVIEPALDLVVPRQDLSGLSPTERAAALGDLESAQGRTPYDLIRGPLFRAALARVSADAVVVVFGAHYLASDGWSLDVLLADLGKIYSAFIGFADLPALPQHGFSDFVNYIGTAEHQARISRAKEFWRQTLQPLPPPLALPADGQRPQQRTYAARHSRHAIAADVHAAAKAFARAEAVSLFAVLMATYATQLFRLSLQQDFVIGTPVAGHPDAGMEDCVGYLVNMVPIRCRVSGRMSFRELCHALNSTALDARENASVGFGEIVAELGLQRDPAHVPLIAAAFTHVQKYAPNKLVFADASVDYEWNPRSFDIFELNLNVFEARDGILFKGYANVDLYSQEWLNRLLAQLEAILASGSAAPGTALDDFVLALDGMGERKALSAPAAAPTGTPEPGAAALNGEVERELLAIWRRLLGRDNIIVTANFFDRGGSSLLAVRLFDEIERRFGRRLPLSTLYSAPTVRQLAAAIGAPAASRNSGIVCLRAGGQGSFFLVHDGLGETLLYQQLAQRLPPSMSVYAIEPRRLPGIALAYTSIEEMAGAYVELIRETQPTGPYLLGGMCAGGTIAYEIAARLRQAGQAVQLLVVIDGGTPQGARRAALTTRRRFSRLGSALKGAPDGGGTRSWIGGALEVLRRARNVVTFETGRLLKRRSLRRRMQLLKRLVRDGAAWPQSVPPLGVMEIYLALEADYLPPLLPDTRLLLARATAGTGIDSPLRLVYRDEDFGWRDVAAHVDIIDVVGGHSSMLQDQGVEMLASEITRRIESAV
jgi:thioesterase domain-containing protein/acyl carrier protein